MPQVVPTSDGLVGGYFTLEADRAITSFSVFGTTTLSALSAVPPQGKNLGSGSVTPPPPTCTLFGDAFDGASLSGWSLSSQNSTWPLVNGKLQVSGIVQGQVAVAEHSLPVSNFFRLTMDPNKFPPGTLFAWTWEEVIQHLTARHKGDARVAVYPYCSIQHGEIDLDEQPRA